MFLLFCFFEFKLRVVVLIAVQANYNKKRDSLRTLSRIKTENHLNERKWVTLKRTQMNLVHISCTDLSDKINSNGLRSFIYDIALVIAKYTSM